MQDGYRTIEEEIKQVKILCNQLETMMTPIQDRHTHKKQRVKHVSMTEGELTVNEFRIKGKNKSTSVENQSKSNRFQTNKAPVFKPPCTEKKSNQKKQINVQPEKVDQMIIRFKHFEQEKMNKILEKKRQFQEMESANLLKVPRINQNSKRLGKTSQGFLERMQEYQKEMEEKQKKIEEQQKLKKEKEDELWREAQKKTKKLKKEHIQSKINNMLHWENQRQQKLTELQMEEMKKLSEECTFTPEINKNTSKKSSQYKDIDEVTERLYKQDIIKRKHKKEILENIYSPSFTPILNHTSNNIVESEMDKYFKSNTLAVDYMTSNCDNVLDEVIKERVRLVKNK